MNNFNGTIKIKDQYFITEDNAKFRAENGKLVLTNNPKTEEVLISCEAFNPECEGCDYYKYYGASCLNCPVKDEIEVKITNGPETTALVEMIKDEFLTEAHEITK